MSEQVSEADWMFKKLAYIKQCENRHKISYTQIGSGTNISFNKDDKLIYISNTGIDKNDIEAINKKVEELGWN